MKPIRSITHIALILALVLTTKAAVVVPSYGETASGKPEAGMMVKAEFRNGVLMPVVDLPEVVITAQKSDSQMVKGTVISGHVMAVVDLPMVEICESRSSAVAAEAVTENPDAIYDIPVIEITGEIPGKNLVHGSWNDESGMAMISLPEVTISGDYDTFAAMIPKVKSIVTASNTTADISEKNIQAGQFHVMLSPNEFTESGNNHMIAFYNCLKTQGGHYICQIMGTLQQRTMQTFQQRLDELLLNP